MLFQWIFAVVYSTWIEELCERGNTNYPVLITRRLTVTHHSLLNYELSHREMEKLQKISELNTGT